MTSSTKPKYRLKVTAGGDYDHATQKQVQVNGDSLKFDSPRASIELAVRIQDYNGYPSNSPATCAYFEDPLHTKDQYSLSFSFTPKEDINGNDLVFGNDFDRPLRDKLPMGFNAALRLVKWTIDPSIDGDAYADQPYLFSPALATWNQFRIGEKDTPGGGSHPKEYVVREGADGEGEKIRSEKGIPETADARMKHFQNEGSRSDFVFEKGRTYLADFGNQYISFSDFSIRLPGFHIPVVDLVDDDHKELRYVLKDFKTGTPYMVVLFTLIDEAVPSSDVESKASESAVYQSQPDDVD